MSLANIRTKLKAGFAAITGLNVAAFIPDTFSPPLCVITLKPGGPVEYALTSKNATYLYHFEVIILVSQGGSVAAAQLDLDPYIDPANAKSIKTKVDTIDLKPDAASVMLITSPTYGGYTVGSTNYLGIKFDLDVLM